MTSGPSSRMFSAMSADFKSRVSDTPSILQSAVPGSSRMKDVVWWGVGTVPRTIECVAPLVGYVYSFMLHAASHLGGEAAVRFDM